MIEISEIIEAKLGMTMLKSSIPSLSRIYIFADNPCLSGGIQKFDEFFLEGTENDEIFKSMICLFQEDARETLTDVSACRREYFST